MLRSLRLPSWRWLPEKLCGFSGSLCCGGWGVLSIYYPFRQHQACGGQARPVEEVAGVAFAAGGDVLVAGYGFDGVVRRHAVQQRNQGLVLCLGERFEIAAFQFDAERKGVAAAAAALLRPAGVVRRVVARHKLHHLPAAFNQKMAGHAQIHQLREEGVCLRVDVVGEQIADGAAAVFEGRQGDVVQHHQRNDFAGGAGREVGRRAMHRALPPAVVPSCGHDGVPKGREGDYSGLAGQAT